MSYIGCYIITPNGNEAIQIKPSMLAELVELLRIDGEQTVHFRRRTAVVQGVYVPAKGLKKDMIIMPAEEPRDDWTR